MIYGKIDLWKDWGVDYRNYGFVPNDVTDRAEFLKKCD